MTTETATRPPPLSQAKLGRRRMPSMPTCSMENSQSWHRNAERQEIVLEATHVGPGRDRATEHLRILTAAEKMHQKGQITRAEWAAASALRDMVVAELGSSEGVGSYGEKRGAGGTTPDNIADRKACNILGRDESNLRRLANLLFAMVGLHDERNTKLLDTELAVIVIASVMRTTSAITLAEIGKRRTAYTGDSQAPSAGGTILKLLYGRAAGHLSYTHLDEHNERRVRMLAMDTAIF